VCAADNQKESYDQLGSLGYAVPIGCYSANTEWRFNLHSIRELLESREKQDSLKNATRLLIDLRGAARVVDTLLSLAVNTEN
jgi:hypothetical protein